MAKLTRPGDLPTLDGQFDALMESAQSQVQSRADFQLQDDTTPILTARQPASSAADAPDPALRQKAAPPTASTQAGELPRLPKPKASGTVGDVLDGMVTSIPIGLAGVSLAYASLPAHFLGMGVMATLLCLGLVHMASGATSRPMAYSARLFEAAALSAMLVNFGKLMPGWGLQGTPEQVLALLCMTSGTAGVVCALLYVLRADRFTRLIPSPVYAGFAISIAILLFSSQSRILYRQWQQGSPWMVLLSVSLASIGAALLVRKFRPRWPSTALAISAGALVGLLWAASGTGVAMITTEGHTWALPWKVADFSSFMAAGVNRTVVATSVFYNGSLLGVMLFINMTVANETISQLDDRYASRWQQAGVSLAVAVGGLSGSSPTASSAQAALAAMRNSLLSGIKCFWIGVLCVLIALLGLLNWVAIAAVAAAMLVDAYFMADRSAIAQAWGWLRGKSLPASQKEDLALVAVVTLTTVVFNVVPAVFVGLLLGLILFARRNAKQPVRFVWTGAQLHSNCARGRHELSVLAQHGERICILELESDLFFGSIASLDKSLRQSLTGAHCVILDWSRVRHVDSSMALSLLRWQRMALKESVRTLHAGVGMQAGNVPNFIVQYLPKATMYQDLDHALEAAEVAIINSFSERSVHDTTQLNDALHIFKDFSDNQREMIYASMQQRLFRAGETVFEAGRASDYMLVVLQGSAAVFVTGAQGQQTRLTSVRRGGVLGEIGFLDQAPRSAHVVAQEDMLAALLTRENFERLREQEPQMMMIFLTNLTLDLSSRLRHTNKLATARSAVQ